MSTDSSEGEVASKFLDLSKHGFNDVLYFA